MGAPPARGPLLLLSAGASVALAVLLWWAVGSRSPATAGFLGSAADEGAVLARERGPALRAPEARSLVETSSVQATRSEAPFEHGLETVLLRGSLVALDEQGRAGGPADGQFELSLWGRPPPVGSGAPSGSQPIGLRERLRDRQMTTVAVRQGRWQVRLPVHTARRFTRGVLDGRPLFDLRAEQLESDDPALLELSVTARRLYPARLSVVDARSLHDLERVSVVVLEGDHAWVHPGDLPPTLTAPVSPLEVPPAPVDRRTYLVGAEGYAWRRVEWNHLSAAARVVELEPAGSIAVAIDADCPLEDWRVTLTAPDGEGPYGSLPAGAGTLQITGVAPGEYQLALVLREARLPYESASLASARVSVIAGQVAAVTLRGRLGVRPARVDLDCRLRMSAAWSAGGPHVAVRALGRTAHWHLDSGGMLGGLEIEREGDSWSVRSSEALAGGRYLIMEGRTAFTRLIELGPQGSQGWVLEIPDPLELTLEVVDGATGLPIPGSELAWLPPKPAGIASPSSPGLWVEAGEVAGVFRARVPAWDSLTFEGRAEGYRPSRITLQPEERAPAGLQIPLDRD